MHILFFICLLISSAMCQAASGSKSQLSSLEQKIISQNRNKPTLGNRCAMVCDIFKHTKFCCSDGMYNDILDHLARRAVKVDGRFLAELSMSEAKRRMLVEQYLLSHGVAVASPCYGPGVLRCSPYLSQICLCALCMKEVFAPGKPLLQFFGLERYAESLKHSSMVQGNSILIATRTSAEAYGSLTTAFSGILSCCAAKVACDTISLCCCYCLFDKNHIVVSKDR